MGVTLERLFWVIIYTKSITFTKQCRSHLKYMVGASFCMEAGHTKYMGEIAAAAAPSGTGAAPPAHPWRHEARGRCINLSAEWRGRAQPLTPDGA